MLQKAADARNEDREENRLMAKWAAQKLDAHIRHLEGISSELRAAAQGPPL